jgi:hypothetical protein
MEPLDLDNVIEVERIREILEDYPDLLIMFETIISIVNIKLNEAEDSR